MTKFIAESLQRSIELCDGMGMGRGPMMGRGFSATAWRCTGTFNDLDNVRLRQGRVTVYGARRCNVTMTDFIVMVLQRTRTGMPTLSGRCDELRTLTRPSNEPVL